MRKIVWIFGIIAGLISASMFFLIQPGAEGSDMTHSEWLGYLFMIVGLGTIFFGVKQYRDQHTDGNISFGKAFSIGIYITLIASVLYVVGWELYATNLAPDWADSYMEQVKQDMADKGMSPEEIETQIASQADMMDLYKHNIFFRLFISFMEIFPVGLVVSLICALIFGVFLKGNSNKVFG